MDVTILKTGNDGEAGAVDGLRARRDFDAALRTDIEDAAIGSLNMTVIWALGLTPAPAAAGLPGSLERIVGADVSGVTAPSLPAPPSLPGWAPPSLTMFELASSPQPAPSTTKGTRTARRVVKRMKLRDRSMKEPP